MVGRDTVQKRATINLFSPWGRLGLHRNQAGSERRGTVCNSGVAPPPLATDAPRYSDALGLFIICVLKGVFFCESLSQD